MNDFVIPCLLSCALGFCLGGFFEQANWSQDCQKLQVHLSSQKIYECKERAK